jgi:hypothetical protein
MGGERETERSRAQCAVLLCAVHTAGRAAESGERERAGPGPGARETDREGAYSLTHVNPPGPRPRARAYLIFFPFSA